jgi:hypothetical protein
MEGAWQSLVATYLRSTDCRSAGSYPSGIVDFFILDKTPVLPNHRRWLPRRLMGKVLVRCLTQTGKDGDVRSVNEVMGRSSGIEDVCMLPLD